MSIQSEITRLSGNVSDALDAIEAKGVTIPTGANSDDLADLIGQIQGGGGVWQDANGYIHLPVEGDGEERSGVLYVYSDLNGEAPVNASGYEYVSCDFAPVHDDKFRFWIDLDESDLTFKAPVTVPSASTYRYTGMIDWGDGSEQASYAYDNLDHTHTYTTAGRYCVSIWWTGGRDAFSLEAPIANDRGKVVAMEFYFKNYPNNTMLYGLPNVRKIRYSSPQTTINFIDCHALKDIVLPESATNISGMYRLYSLERLTIPASVVSIGSGAFQNNTSMKEYHFKPIVPPTLANTTVFNGIPSDCVIYVPTESLTAYQTAQNWSTYASKMVGE